MKTCKWCGKAIIFRRGRRMPDGTWRRWNRPFPVHIYGSCTKKK
jgi:hypothetical protein